MAGMPTIEAVAFDCDGLMFNTEDSFNIAGRELLRRQAVDGVVREPGDDGEEHRLRQGRCRRFLRRGRCPIRSRRSSTLLRS